MFSFSTMYAILAVMVAVLPAPARISWEDRVCLIEESWWDFMDDERMGSEKYAPSKTICKTADEHR